MFTAFLTPFFHIEAHKFTFQTVLTRSITHESVNDAPHIDVQAD